MAEIKIEKKKPIWPWIIVILIILAAIYFFWYLNDNDRDMEDDLVDNDTIDQIDDDVRYNENDLSEETYLYTGTYGTVRDEQAVADYLNFVDTEKNVNKVSDKDYFRSAYLKLITATKRAAEIKNVEVSEEISKAMENAQMINNDPATDKNTDKIKATSENISNALRKIQEETPNELLEEANAVYTAYNSINASGTIEEDKDDIHEFLDKAAIMLQRMYNDNDENR